MLKANVSFSFLTLLAVKAFKNNYVNTGKHESVAALFPLAKLHGPVSPEFAKIWEEQNHAFETHKESNSALLYEKVQLRGMLLLIKYFIWLMTLAIVTTAAKFTCQ